MQSNADTSTAPDWPALLSDREAAAYAGIGKSTLWKLVSSDDFPAPVKLPGTTVTRFRRADLDTWIEGLEATK